MPQAASSSALDSRSEFLADVLEGLSRPQKSVPPKYFYDAAGSALFEAICLTPEYYPTRTETALLARVAPDLSRSIAPGSALVEFGSGASEKTRLLLDALPQISAYIPIDISADALAPAVARIVQAYPGLQVAPVEADFTSRMQPLQLERYTGVLGFFPGSTIGNFNPAEAKAFLEASRDLLGPDGAFLIGADLVKDPNILIAAYDDAQGVTAAFNLNLLERINAELGGDFDRERFGHVARWNAAQSRMEMHLESLAEQDVHIAGRSFHFGLGESLHTENSYKFTTDGFGALARSAGWRVAKQWIAEGDAFAAFLLEPA